MTYILKRYRQVICKNKTTISYAIRIYHCKGKLGIARIVCCYKVHIATHSRFPSEHLIFNWHFKLS